jgi:hypothetical protein
MRADFPPRARAGGTDTLCSEERRLRSTAEVLADRFELRRRLGEGGMGVVYEAYDRQRRELVALKTLQRVDARSFARLKREFRALHDLSHPNLVALGELFDQGAVPFFTMELVQGVDFLSFVRPGAAGAERLGSDHFRSPPASTVLFDEARLRSALRQLALGITAIHAAGKIHRDIKPQNVLVTAQERVVLLDFGLVVSVHDGPRSTEVDAVGTVAYMAPEQSSPGELTPAADWYSLGVVLFEALTGTLPHSGRTDYEVFLNRSRFMAAPPRQFVPNVPPDLDALCSELLEREPERRPTPRDICDRLGIDVRDTEGVEMMVRSMERTATSYFVGRSEELSGLRRAHEAATSGPRIFLIEGISGVGKTQLAEEFIRQLRLEEPDTVVLAGRCYEREVVSYKALDGIVEELARYLAHQPRVQAAALMPQRPALLGRLFPVLLRVAEIAAEPRAQDLPDPQDQRRRMFAQLRELFRRLAQRHRLVWFIDDLHWTDADSLVLLEDLLAHEERFPLLLIATLRPMEDAPQRALCARIEALAACERWRLSDLPRGDARALAALLLPGRDDHALDALAADLGGHPLLLHEAARHVAALPGAGPGSATFDEMLTARIGRMRGDAQLLLQLVALYAGPLSLDVAAIAAETSHAELVAAVRVLRAAHLVRTDGLRPSDRVVSYHDRVREHVTARLEPGMTERLHERLALALRQTGAAEHNPRALVRHARAAGRTRLAASYALSAARFAVDALAFEQAAEFFSVALTLGEHSPAEECVLRIELGTALVHAGRGPEAAEVFMKAAESADPAVRLDCQRRAAEQWIITGHLEKGMGALRAQLADVGEPLAPTPRQALLRVLFNRTRLRLTGLHYQPRMESQVSQEALRRLDVLKAVAHGLSMVDNIRGADFNSRFMLLALRTGEPLRLAGALGSEVVFLVSQGGRAAKRGRKLYEELLLVARDGHREPYVRTWVHLSDGAASFFEGRFRASVASLEKAEEVFSEGPRGLTYERNNTQVFRVHSLRLLGALRRHGALITEHVRLGRQRGDRYIETTLTLLQGPSLLAVGDVEGARSAVEEAKWAPLVDGFHVQHWSALRALSELALYEGKSSSAVRSLAPRFAALERSLLLRLQIVRADALSLRGRLLLAAAADGHVAGRARAEVERLARALEREKIGFASVYASLLRAGLASVDPSQTPEQTVAHLRRAEALARDADMALHLAAARHRLGALLGGDEGRALTALAHDYAREEGIVSPEAMFGVVLPGTASAGKVHREARRHGASSARGRRHPDR